MKIPHSELKRLLALIAPVVPKNPTLNILGNVLLSAENDIAYLTASNMDIEITVRGRVEGDLAPVCVSPNRLQAALAAGEDLTFRRDGERLAIRAGRSRYAVSTLLAKDFPRRDQVNTGEWVGLENISASIARVLPFSAVKDIRYYLQAVYLEQKDGHLYIVATDGHRLAQIAETCNAPIAPILLPSAVAELIARGGFLRMRADKRSVVLLADQMEVHAALVDGTYPDWQRILPDATRQIAVETTDIRRSVEAIQGYADARARGVTLSKVGDELTLASADASGDETASTIPAEGDDFSVGFNVTYLTDMIRAIRSERLQLAWGDPPRAFQIVEGSAVFILMPMRV